MAQHMQLMVDGGNMIKNLTKEEFWDVLTQPYILDNERLCWNCSHKYIHYRTYPYGECNRKKYPLPPGVVDMWKWDGENY